eukprot:m.219972 g.219972  ORF g.219972 m.219972 type:complete len:188 (-) comp10285_c1_seq1:14-577(-)
MEDVDEVALKHQRAILKRSIEDLKDQRQKASKARLSEQLLETMIDEEQASDISSLSDMESDSDIDTETEIEIFAMLLEDEEDLLADMIAIEADLAAADAEADIDVWEAEMEADVDLMAETMDADDGDSDGATDSEAEFSDPFEQEDERLRAEVRAKEKELNATEAELRQGRGLPPTPWGERKRNREI